MAVPTAQRVRETAAIALGIAVTVAHILKTDKCEIFAILRWEGQHSPSHSLSIRPRSAIADDIKERIEKGLLDMGLLVEPVDISKYEFIRMPVKERWGILVREDSPLAEKDAVTPEDLYRVPLIMVRRELVKNELSNWFGDRFEQLEVAATYNLIVNAANMVEKGLRVALCFDLGAFFDNLRFVPLAPCMETGSVLVWKTNQILSEAHTRFTSAIPAA